MSEGGDGRTDDPRTAERVKEMSGPGIHYPTHEELGDHGCDLVMKGGITSGIVYPLAACELARTYRFRSIGGSSAGAIGAVLVAAAEHGRDRDGFRKLAEIPIKLGPRLGDMFTAGPGTATALAALKAWLQPGQPVPRRVGHVLGALVGAQRRSFLVGFLAVFLIGIGGALVVAGLPHDGGDWARLAVVTVALTLPVAAGVGLLVALVAEAQASRANLATQGFGICVGSDGPQARDSSDPGPFTDWMTAEIDRVAGVPGPLTIGDLRGPDAAEPEIELRVMTTNLTMGRPQTFPFADRTYLFDPVELRAYFPPKVLDHLLRDQQPATADDGTPLLAAEDPVPAGPRPSRGLLGSVGGALLRLLGWRAAAPRPSDERRPLYWLPESDRLPVVLAARLSLSFPALISAVPLWAVERSNGGRPRRCWMTDGGLTANFPVHFFDSPLPSRPTFAIDLQSYPDGGTGPDVIYPGPGEDGLRPRFTTIASMQGFGARLLDTMQYWADNAQSALPGYRDRIVEVRLRRDEGGMNLQMPTEVIFRAAEKGRQAAEQLEQRFDFGVHRWIRYLTVIGRMENAVDQMASRWDHDLPGGAPGYHDFVLDDARQPLYDRDADWRAAAVTRTGALLSFASGVTDKPDFLVDAPPPDPELRITPRY